MSGSAVLDLGLVMLLLAYAVSGYRQGLVSSVFSLVGFFGGALFGIWMLPSTLRNWDAVANDDRLRIAALVIGVVLLGWLGQFMGSLVGGLVRRRLGWQTLRRADHILGAVAVAVAAALIIGFLGASLRSIGNPAIARATADSKVLQVLDRVVPAQTWQVFAGFRSFLSQQGFPQVFGGLAPEPISPVQPPDPAIARAPGVAAVERSVVKVTTRSASCRRNQEGTGWVLSPGRIVTNAHVVAGSEQIRVETDGQTLTGDLVILDPRRDLAVITVPGLDAPALQLGTDLTRGATAAIPGYPLDGPYRVAAARVRTVLDARGLDIYGSDRVEREIYSLATRVQPGNSGGPLVDESGRVVGVVFAKSLEDDNTGYALTLQEAKPVLDEAATARRPVDSGACLVG